MRCAARSVIPIVSPISRKRTPGSLAMQSITWAWLVRNDHVGAPLRGINARLWILDSFVICPYGCHRGERGRMPHLKCEPCRNRLYRAGSGDQVGDLCPACGSLLEPVGQLAELVGLLVGSGRSHQRLADQLGDLIVRRHAAYAEARLD